MSADPIIRMSCETCGMTVEVPFDTVGEMYATEFSERHAHVSVDPSPCCAACDRFGEDGDPTARGCGLPDCGCHDHNEQEQGR